MLRVYMYTLPTSPCSSQPPWLHPLTQLDCQGTEERLEFMHCLAEEDKEGVCMKSILRVLWEKAGEVEDDTLCRNILAAHVKILQLFCERVKNWEVIM